MAKREIKMRKVEAKPYRNVPMAEPMSKPLPSFRIDLDHLPEAKKMKLGKEYTLQLKVRMNSISEDKYSAGAGFDIIGIGCDMGSGSKKVADMEEEDDESESETPRRYSEEDDD